jgi:hypothetical protein
VIGAGAVQVAHIRECDDRSFDTAIGAPNGGCALVQEEALAVRSAHGDRHRSRVFAAQGPAHRKIAPEDVFAFEPGDGPERIIAGKAKKFRA